MHAISIPYSDYSASKSLLREFEKSRAASPQIVVCPSPFDVPEFISIEVRPRTVLFKFTYQIDDSIDDRALRSQIEPSVSIRLGRRSGNVLEVELLGDVLPILEKQWDLTATIADRVRQEESSRRQAAILRNTEVIEAILESLPETVKADIKTALAQVDEQ